MFEANGGYPPPLEFGDVVRFLDKVNANAVCPVCGGNHGWGIVARLQAPGVADHYPGLTCAHESGSVDNSSAFPVITVTCKNCGYVRLHDARIVRQRLSELEGEANG